MDSNINGSANMQLHKLTRGISFSLFYRLLNKLYAKKVSIPVQCSLSCLTGNEKQISMKVMGMAKETMTM